MVDAVGPEVFTFRELVRLIAGAVGSRAAIVPAPPGLALLLARLVGVMVGDVVLTRDEVKGLMAGLLVSSGPVTGEVAFSHWVRENAAVMGRGYASELGRHYRD